MKKMKKSLMVVMAFVLVLTFFSSFTAEAAGNGENFDKSGILQINVYHVDANTNNKILLQSGSGFLISDSADGAQYVITCNHVANVSSADQAYICESLAVDRLNIKIEVVITRDLTQSVSIVQASEEADFAILKLDAPIYERQPLVLNPEGPSLTEDVYAMGYPDAIQALQDFVYYSESDVVVTKGSVSMCEMLTGGVPYIQHSAVVTAGNSGGPLLDSDGYVVGLNTFVQTLETGNYYYSLSIKEVTNALDALGINYLTAGDNTGTDSTAEEITTEQNQTGEDDDTTETEPVAEEAMVDKSQLSTLLLDAKSYAEEDYTEESYSNLQDAINEADIINNKLDATQAEIDDAVTKLNTAISELEKAKSDNTMMIIIIAAAAVVVIIIVVVIVAVSSSNKKKAAEEQRRRMMQQNTSMGGSGMRAGIPGGYSQNMVTAQVPPAMAQQSQRTAPQPPQPPASPAMQNPYNQASFGEGAGETSVLGYGGGETTVLGGINQSKATLTRVKTNERVDIAKQLFRIGKERNKVDYCITNNNSVSRIHADIVFKNGAYFIIDNNSTNYTFVNGQMIPAKQEVAISDGDRIKFAEEEFIFKIG